MSALVTEKSHAAVVTHTPPQHCAPVSHALPQTPQFRGSVVTSTHTPLHARLGDAHEPPPPPLPLAPELWPESGSVKPLPGELEPHDCARTSARKGNARSR